MLQTSKYHFKITNLHVDCDIDISQYFDLKKRYAVKPDVTIQRGNIELRHLKKSILANKFNVFSTESYAEIYKPEIGSFIIKSGNKITYMPSMDAKIPNLIIFIFSYVFSYLIYQRGGLAIHASAIEVEGNSFFFCGRSGAGKSTLAWALSKGRGFLTEDSCFFKFSDKNVSLFKSLPFIKLDNTQTIDPAIKKYSTQTDKRNRTIFSLIHEPLNQNSLRCGFFLKLDDNSKIKKITKNNAFKNLLANTFFAYPYDQNISEQKNVMENIALVVNKCDFYEVCRKKNEDFNIDMIKKIVINYI